ncbi:hypothetical protein AB0O47_32135 [Streptomyces noursei]|uniref:hypothetical protein n=1 Tax=Streptomyces noursei TaxID=1971 RepID=UPI00344C162F
MSAIVISPEVRARLRGAGITPAAYLVAIHLLIDTDAQGWRPCRELVAETGLTTHQVRQVARSLKGAQLIDQCRRYANVQGRKTTETLYRLKGDQR